jgi:ribosomal protein S18 acetylase RimI-like enzyme
VRFLDPETAEMKRLYVRAEHRGRGLGRALAHAAINAAREAGCRRIVLDTLPKMREAQALYRGLDFHPIAPYLKNPTPGALCFELRLS